MAVSSVTWGGGVEPRAEPCPRDLRALRRPYRRQGVRISCFCGCEVAVVRTETVSLHGEGKVEGLGLWTREGNGKPGRNQPEDALGRRRGQPLPKHEARVARLHPESCALGRAPAPARPAVAGGLAEPRASPRARAPIPICFPRWSTVYSSVV